MVNIHAQSVEQALSALRSDASRGLADREAAARLAEKGPNELPKDKKPSLVVLFLRHWAGATDPQCGQDERTPCSDERYCATSRSPAIHSNAANGAATNVANDAP